MLSFRFDSALQTALTLHRAQSRKGTSIPYVSHLLTVAGTVLECGGTENEAIAALLHDAIEDAGQTEETLALLFGEEVAAIVAACTDDLPGLDRTLSGIEGWRLRKEAYIAHLSGVNDSVLLVSCADKLANARSIIADVRAYGVCTLTRFKAGQEGTLWYYWAVSNATLARTATGNRPRLHALAEELARAVTELETVCAAPPLTA